MTNFIRVLTRNEIVNVFKSDAVIWWAAIFCRRAPKKGGGSQQGGGLPKERCVGGIFRGSVILPWTFAVDHWIRGQQVWFGEEDDNNTGEVGERDGEKVLSVACSKG